MISWIFILFHGLQSNTIIIHFVVQSVPAWSLGTPSDWLSCVFSGPPLILFRILPYFLALEDVPSSSCSFPDPALESVTSPSSFKWRMVFRNRDLGTEHVHFCGGIIASRPSQLAELRNICMFTDLHIQTHLYLLLYLFLCVY